MSVATAAPMPDPLGQATRQRIARVEVELAEIDRQTIALGDRLLVLDKRAADLRRERKFHAATLKMLARKGGRRCGPSI